jgi:Glycosyltransferase family 87
MDLVEQLNTNLATRILDPMSNFLTKVMLLIIKHWDRALVALSVATSCSYLLYIIFIARYIFWDFTVYAHAVDAIGVGMTPYSEVLDSEVLVFNAPLQFQFVYPPFVAQIFYMLRWLFVTPSGLAILVIMHVIAWASIPYLLAGSPRKWYSWKFAYLFSFYMLLFGRGGLKILVSGNITGLLSALLILSMMVVVRSKRYKLFWFAILLYSSVKIYCLSFLLIPIILDKKYVAAAIFFLAVLTLYAVEYAFNPYLFREYIEAIVAQSQDSNFVGLSLYSLSNAAAQLVLGRRQLVDLALALGLHFTFIAVIILFAHAVAHGRPRPAQFDLFCCWIFMSAYLTSPRLNDYDIGVFIVPFVLLAEMLLTKGGLGMYVAAAVAVCGSIFMRSPLTEWSCLFAILGVWLGSGIHWLVSGQSDRSNEEKSQSAADQPSRLYSSA